MIVLRHRRKSAGFSVSCVTTSSKLAENPAQCSLAELCEDLS
ncbi:hypothetical protein BSU04_34820 [Caballeronia sordidicola]|uniref:Uncharacterized protein n=1 Tax=Caballeronia sordidicola TaxID=196367 RepID=A0A226WSQ0_CABSO|nr:hypothetical protein BSU04_34820 [Caballeronia sordidicola]